MGRAGSYKNETALVDAIRRAVAASPEGGSVTVPGGGGTDDASQTSAP